VFLQVILEMPVLIYLMVKQENICKPNACC